MMLLDLAAGGNGMAFNPPTASSGSFGQIDIGGTNALRFNTNATERLRIDSSGTTTPSGEAFRRRK